MATQITESDEVAFDAAIDLDVNLDEPLSWDTDPAAILERRELEFGVNCFDQPIN